MMGTVGVGEKRSCERNELGLGRDKYSKAKFKSFLGKGRISSVVFQRSKEFFALMAQSRKKVNSNNTYIYRKRRPDFSDHGEKLFEMFASRIFSVSLPVLLASGRIF